MRKVLAILLAATLLGFIASPVWSAGTLKVTTPNGGQEWSTGKKYTIKWTKGNAGAYVKIQLLKSGKAYKTIKVKTKNDGRHRWKIPASVKTGSAYKIRITSVSKKTVKDQSNKNFTITKASGRIRNPAKPILKPTATVTTSSALELTTPNGAQKWLAGKAYTIRWDKGDGKGKVKIQLLKSGRVSLAIHNNTKNDGRHRWKIPSSVATGGAYKIKITSKTNSRNADSSNSNFTITGVRRTIANKSLTVTSPNGREIWRQGETRTITWNSSNLGGSVRIDLYKGGSYDGTVVAATSNDGRHRWKIPSSVKTGSNYKARITSTANASVFDLSRSNFTIGSASASSTSRSLTVTGPNGGETWKPGEKRTISWDSTNLSGSVKIDLYRSGSYDGTVVSSTPNDGIYRWTVPASVTAGSNYKARISSTTYRNVFDSSKSNFTVEGFSRSITLTSPNGGESWTAGETKTISWNSSNAGIYVKIDLYKSDSHVVKLSPSTPNDGSYRWSISSSLAAGSDYKIKVIPKSYTHISDSSNSNFTIKVAEVEEVEEDEGPVVVGPAKVLSPNGGECYQLGDKLTVTWTGGINSSSEMFPIQLVDREKNWATNISAQDWPNNANQSWTWTVATNRHGSFGNSNIITLGSYFKILINFPTKDWRMIGRGTTNLDYYWDESDETFSILESCP